MPGVAITVTPPTSASEHSPDRNACTARCSATNDDEHAVSTVTAGPSNPNAYDTRPDMTLAALPVTRYPSTPSDRPPDRRRSRDASRRRTRRSSLPRNDAGSIPARSNASHDVSSNNRCCGSIANASRGEIPKNPASNSAASYRNPPSVAYEVPGWSGSGSYRPSRSQPRSVGKPPIASRAGGDQLPQVLRRADAAGKPAAHPTIAIGSRAASVS